MFIGAHVILSATAQVNTKNSGLYIPYMIIGAAALLLIIAFWVSSIPNLSAPEEAKPNDADNLGAPLFSRGHFTMGVVAQFLYVAAQTGIFSFFINYSVANVAGLSDRAAGNLQTMAFALFALGRLLGSVVVGTIRPQLALVLGGFKWSLQHFIKGGCDGKTAAAFGSVRAGFVTVAGSAACSGA
jgi:FHS family L-fucose permease-like MFS transporter